MSSDTNTKMELTRNKFCIFIYVSWICKTYNNQLLGYFGVFLIRIVWMHSLVLLTSIFQTFGSLQGLSCYPLDNAFTRIKDF